MNNYWRLRIAIFSILTTAVAFGLTFIGGVPASTVSAEDIKEKKIDVCHYNEGKKEYVDLHISVSARESGHGDHEKDYLGKCKVEDDGECLDDCEPDSTIKLVAHKIICENEEDLPDRGKSGGPNLDEDSAEEFVEENEDCYLAEDWSFEWAPRSGKYPGGDHYGTAGGDWTTFGTTDSDGMVMTKIDVEEVGKVIQVREVLQPGFIPFSDKKNNSFSAEFYCHTDVANYDNLDWIQNPKAGETYYCIGFNAPKPKGDIHIKKLECPWTIEDMEEMDINWEAVFDQEKMIDWSRYGCRWADGYEFGVQVARSDGPIRKLGETADGGTLRTEITEGYYMIGELDEEGDWMEDEDMLKFMCNGRKMVPDQVAVKIIDDEDEVRPMPYRFNPQPIEVSDEYPVHCLAINPMKDLAKVVAHKVVCENEEDLPNRQGKDIDIDEDTAEEYVANNKNCWLESDWDFQWAPASEKNPGDTLTGPAGEPWTTFGPTDEDGMAMTFINIEEASAFWFREVLKDGYIPFTYGPEGKKNTDNYTAEFYCDTDVANYDNYEKIEGMEEEETYYCVAFNTEKEKAKPKLVAHKIVCEAEEYLPNRQGQSIDIDENTAVDFVDNSKGHCRLESDWDFQWAPASEKNPGDTLYGPAGEPWTTFGSTDGDGMTMTSIDIDKPTGIWVREVLKENYIPFTYGPEGKKNTDDVTAEFYCHTDVANYDNYEKINVSFEETYHCVAFNAPKKKPTGKLHITKVVCPVDWYSPYDKDEDRAMEKLNMRNGRDEFDWKELKRLGCMVGEGFEFGVDAEDDSYPYYPWDGDGIQSIGETNEEGNIWTMLPEGEYNVGELNGEGEWKDEEQMIKFMCRGPQGPLVMPEYDGDLEEIKSSIKPVEKVDTWVDFNPQTIYIDDEYPTYCLAINPKDPVCGNGYVEGDEECDDGNDEEYDGCTSECVETRVSQECGAFYLKLDTDGEEGFEYIFPLYDGFFYENDDFFVEGLGAKDYRFGLKGKKGGSSIDATAYIINGQLDGDIVPDFSGEHKLEKNTDTIEGTDGASSFSFYLEVNNSGKWNDEFDFSIEEVDACKGTIIGRKYRDVNGNGTFNKIEKNAVGDVNRLDGRTISLYDTDWNLIDSMETGDDSTDAGNVDKGQYKFVNVPAGTYYVCETLQEDWEQTGPTSGVEYDGTTCHKVEVAYEEVVAGIQFGNREDLCEEYVKTYASSVVEANQGLKKNGGVVNANRSTPTDVLGAPDGSGNPVSGFYSLGFGGDIVVSFDQPVFNKAGDDISIHELTNGRASYPEETAKIEVSVDGVNRVQIGTTSSKDGDSYFDLDTVGLYWITYVRITDTTDASLHNNNADGFDLDAVDAVYACVWNEDDNGGDDDSGDDNGGDDNGGDDDSGDDNGGDDNGGDDDGGDDSSSTTSNPGGRRTSVTNIVENEDDDTGGNDEEEEDTNSNGGSSPLPLLETGGGDEAPQEEQPEEQEGLKFSPNTIQTAPSQLASTGGHGITMKMVRKYIQAIWGMKKLGN